MRVFSYVIDHDLGFAPNPFHQVCTLSACKPKIRQHAKVGDYIAGTGSKPSNLQNRLVYWMKVDEILTFDQYWNKLQFRCKRPIMSGSRMQVYGDNIYYRGPDGGFVQQDSFHSEDDGSVSQPNLDRDTGTTDRVLIGYEYAYWGEAAPPIPERLSDLTHPTQGHRCNFPMDRAEAFVSWFRGMQGRGFLGRPANWPR